MEDNELISAIESILFTSDQPVSMGRLQEVFGTEAAPEENLARCLREIKEKYLNGLFGFELREASGGYQFSTKAQNSDWVRKFLETKPFRLSRSALETLAIISYRQPITRAELDKVRGIDSSHLLRVLIEKGIVKMAGKADVPGRPVQYATTPKFLDLVGFNSLSDLPPLTELQQLQGDVVEPPQESLEDGLARFMNEQDFGTEAVIHAENGLEEIEQMLESVQKAGGEVYASPLHAEVGHENEAAVTGFQAFSRHRHRKSRTTTAANDVELPAAPPEPEPSFLESADSSSVN